ncbi:hypothetical protein F2Q70_00014280 [Brassica cretica]|uniref:RRM domain-containing protein n=2 Tax=Brassica cretica TaxID=69181 RepID=A0A8S9HWD5_BRACR|nr:hypothetical protein F2Q70_00014280 [Brassica cretica]
MDSSSSSSSLSITREEFNAFHKFERDLFTRIVISLRRDISLSFEIMCFLIYLEKSVFMSKLIFNLVSLPDLFINTVIDEVVMCLRCLSYENFPTFVASLKNINSLSIPWIRRMTRQNFTLEGIHQKREDILLEMKKHLTSICYPAFEDICVRFEMQNKEKMHTSSHFLCGQQATTNHAAGTSNVEGQQLTAEDRTVFLTFSKGYPISEVEVYEYFTRRFGDIVEAIHMGGVGGKDLQALYARMVLRSASKIPEIVKDEACPTKFAINGKHVKARKFIPIHKSVNNPPYPSFGVSL